MARDPMVVRSQPSALAGNKVIRNTYMLLSLTLFFSAAMSVLAMVNNAPPLSPWITLIGYFALLFLTTATRNSGFGLLSVFLFTGFMGYTLGPILNLYLDMYTNGAQLIATAFAGTAMIFLALSAYAISSKKDFSYMGGFLSALAMVAFLAGIGAMVFNMPIMSLMVSAAFVLVASGFILFETSQIINGGETNYIMATISLYVSILNLFMSLLRLLAAFGGQRN